MDEKETPILTIGMIVKNEETHLERTLRSFESLRNRIPCEVIIADTGSQDKSIEIAQKYADEVFHFTWIDDFAAARNAVMDKARGKWYWSIDADEPLAEDIDHIVRFFSSDLCEKFDIGTYLLRNKTSYEESDQFTDHFVRRMFRMATGLRFVHPIHEVVPSLPMEKMITFNELTAYHYGYRYQTEEQLLAKQARNIALLEREMERQPNDLKLLCEMLDVCVSEDAERYAAQALDVMRKDPTHPMMRRAIYCTLDLYYRRQLFERALALDEEFSQCYQNSVAEIDIQFMLAYCASALNHYEQAQQYAERYFKAIQAYDEGAFNSEIKTSFLMAQHTPQRRQDMKALLVMVLVRQQKNDEALKYFAELELDIISGNMMDVSAACFAQFAREGGDPVCLANYYAKMHELMCNRDERKRSRAVAFSNTVGNIALRPNHKENLPVLQALAAMPGEDDVLRFTRLVLSEDEPEFALRLCEYFGSVTRWDNAFPAVYRLAFRHGVALPEAAFCISAGRADYLTGVLAGYDDFVPNTLQYWQSRKCGTLSLAEVLFIFTLLTRSLIAFELVKDDAQKAELLEAFTQTADVCLEQLYRTEAFESDAHFAIPALHMFAYWMCRANSAAPAEGITFVKKALEAMPAQKAAVQFLTKQLEAKLDKEDANRKEFEALAKSVKEEAYRLVAQGQIEQARAVVTQLKTLCPDDEEVDELLLMLPSSLPLQ